MNRRYDAGQINVLLVPLILMTLFFIGAGAFGYWAYSGRQDYKNNSDQKVNAAVATAKQQEDAVKDKAFAEQEKSPFRTYTGPSAYGSLIIQYPKTWSAYVDESGATGNAIDGYFDPSVVPSVTSQNSAFALRAQIVNGSYSDVINNNYASYVASKQIAVTPFAFNLVPGAVGVRLDGTIEPNKTGSMVLVPLRDKTLKIWTDTPQFMDDFNKNILPNVRFSP